MNFFTEKSRNVHTAPQCSVEKCYKTRSRFFPSSQRFYCFYQRKLQSKELITRKKFQHCMHFHSIFCFFGKNFVKAMYFAIGVLMKNFSTVTVFLPLRFYVKTVSILGNVKKCLENYSKDIL